VDVDEWLTYLEVVTNGHRGNNPATFQQ